MNWNVNLSGWLWRISILAYKLCPHGGSFHYKLLEVLFSFWVVVHKVDAVIHVLKKRDQSEITVYIPAISEDFDIIYDNDNTDGALIYSTLR